MRKIFILISAIIFVISVIILANYYNEKKDGSAILNAPPADEAAIKDEAKTRLSPADEAVLKEREAREKAELAMPVDEAALRLSPADEERIKREEEIKNGVSSFQSPANEAAIKDEAKTRLSPADETRIKGESQP